MNRKECTQKGRKVAAKPFLAQVELPDCRLQIVDYYVDEYQQYHADVKYEGEPCPDKSLLKKPYAPAPAPYAPAPAPYAPAPAPYVAPKPAAYAPAPAPYAPAPAPYAPAPAPYAPAPAPYAPAPY